MKRYVVAQLSEFLEKKMVLLMGPRQVGKTTLAKSLTKNHAYYNYDIKKDLKVFRDLEWDHSKQLVIFDELHKMKRWKLWLKGIFDQGATEKQQFLVTGSARLDIAKRLGDSLAGRFFSIRLSPLDLKELKGVPGLGGVESTYKRLLNVGGFPEPFFEGTERFYNLWSKTHSDIILRQDLISLEAVRDIDGLELLVEMLASRVGSTVSFNALSEDLQRDDKTVKRWLSLLEQMYIIFRVSPYSKNVTRGIKKAGKYYFYDCAKVEGDEAVKLENLAALSIKKEIEFQEDCEGIPGQLYFIQTREKHEIDFLTVQKKRTPCLIEVKLGDEEPSRNFAHFVNLFPQSRKLQWVRHLTREFTSKNGIEVKSALDALSNLDLG
jgi:predicted AAA+ superfamily ATPase